ncbi:MAG: DNA repair protein RecO [Candidatus Subteraquimicrobiales bacterium]|nr:DNA repair protein RecO [Candidatus Subteraquimicrobiales bacterium]
MAIYKTKGIVLKTHKLGEADKIITILSDSRGKIRAVAKGLRKTVSRFGGRLEPFTYVNLVLYEGRNLDTINQVDIIESFKEIRDDLDKVTYGSAMLDLADKLVLEGERDNTLFFLLIKALKALLEREKNEWLILLAFNLQSMAVSGYAPSLFSCLSCRAAVKPSALAFFSNEWGGVLCEKCAEADFLATQVSYSLLELMVKILNSSFANLARLDVGDKERKELNTIINSYVDYHLQAKLKSHLYLSQIE